MIKTNPLPLLKTTLMAGLLLVISACSKPESDIATFVPEGAPVLAIDFSRLESKLDTATLRDNMIVKFFELSMMAEGRPSFLSNKSVTGLDFSRELLLFMRQNVNEATPFIVARIKDKSKFEKLVGYMAGEGNVFDTLDIRLANSSPFSVGWKDDVAVISFEAALEEIPAIFQNKREEATEEVRELIAMEKDIAAYMPPNSSAQVTELLPLPATLRNQNLPLEWLSLDFQDGQAALEGSFAPATHENMRDWLHVPANDLLNRLPGGNPYGYMVIGAKWQQLQEVLAASENPSKYKDLLNRIGQIAGDEVAIGLYGVQPDGFAPTFVGSFDVKENAAATLSGWQGEHVQPAGENRFMITAEDTFFVVLNGNEGLFTNDENLLSSTQTLSWQGLNTDLQNPVQLMIDVDRLLANVQADHPGHPVASYASLLQILQTVEFALNQDDDVLQFHLQASFKNQDENSLEQIFQAINQMIAGSLPF